MHWYDFILYALTSTVQILAHSRFKILLIQNSNWEISLLSAVWGGDPVYPTVNYIQDPDEVIDYRGPDFHEPTPNMLSFLKEVFFLSQLICFLSFVAFLKTLITKGCKLLCIRSLDKYGTYLVKIFLRWIYHFMIFLQIYDFTFSFYVCWNFNFQTWCIVQFF